MTRIRPIVVGGLHGSGAQALPRLLEQHPRVGVMVEDREAVPTRKAKPDGKGQQPPANSEVLQGQSIQSVFEHEDYFGGPGAFAFHPDAHLDPADDRWRHADFERLRGEWEAGWPDGTPIGVEYSPSNVVRARFLAEAFPNGVHVYVHRHPILDALRTREKTDDRSQPLDVLVRHWLAAHRQLLEDLGDMEDCYVISFDELRRNTGDVLDEIFDAAGLDSVSVDSSDLRSIGRDAWTGWDERLEEQREPIVDLEDRISLFGYEIERPGFEGNMAVERILGTGPTNGGLDVDTLRPDAIELTDRGPDVTLPQRLLVVAFGTRSDVHSCIAAAAALSDRGYDVTVLSTEDHRDLATAVDVPFEGVHPEASVTLPTPDADEKEQFEAYLREMYRFYDAHGADIIGTLSTEIDQFDCVLVGRGVFFRDLLAYHFQIPLVELEDSPTHLDRTGDAPEHSVAAYAEQIIEHAYAVESFKIGTALDAAYETCDIDFRHTEEGFSEALIRNQSTRILRAPDSPIADNELPGLPDTATGCWTTGRTVRSDDTVAPDTRAFLDGAEAPVCVDLAKTETVGPTAPDWVGQLFDVLADRGHECLVVGGQPPPGVTTDVHVVEPAAAPHVYPDCQFVVHDANPVSTVGGVESETPALAVPPVTWDRGPVWARWIDETNAGVYVRSPERDLAAHVDEITDPRYVAGVRALASRVDFEQGVANVVAAFEQSFGAPDEALTRDWQTMVYIDSLDVAPWRKTDLLAYPLLREPTASTADTLALRETFLDTIDATRRTYPVYEPDWPHKGKPLDLSVHDLPHESSGTEWWYYHAHLETASGTELSLFSVLFKRLIEESRLGHGHAGVVDVDADTHEQRSIGDPEAPETIAPRLARASADDYAQRALREVYEKGEYPAPDRTAGSPLCMPPDRVEFQLGDMTVEKDEGDYLIGLAPGDDREFGFSLRFSPQKPPVRHYEDGVMKGVTSEADMFYYSIPRMAVTGHVVLDGERERVEGSGWYDHEFGGGTERDAALGGAHSWLWMGIQLADGSEIGYTTVTNLDSGTHLHEDAILHVSPEGERTHYEGHIEECNTWSSMYTYVEYGTAWRLTVPELDLELDIEAVRDRQEVRSVIARPAYWEGRIEISGTRDGEAIAGRGICEQYGQGGDRSNYREFLDDVSREVQRSVRDVLPYDMTDEELERLVASEDMPELAEGVDPDILAEATVRPVRTIVERGGKGWRSMALLVAAEAAGEDPHRLERYLAFPELIHTGSLMIDDIEDDSDRRRGGPSAHRQFGVPLTINAGTSAYFMMERLHEEMDFSDDQLLRMYQLHMQALRGGHTGQAMDIYGLDHKVPECLETGDFTPIWETLKATHRLKSAVPAMIAARIGAVAAGADRETEDVLGEYFLAIGYAFQLVDDAINLRGFEHDLKEHAEDLLAGKITAPVARAFLVLEDTDRHALWHQLQADPEETDVAAILSLLEGCGAVDWCHDRAREIVEAAWEPVDDHFPESQTKMRLRAFGWFVVDVRDY